MTIKCLRLVGWGLALPFVAVWLVVRLVWLAQSWLTPDMTAQRQRDNRRTADAYARGRRQ